MLRTIATSGIAGYYCDFLRRGRPRHRWRAIAWHVWTGPGAHRQGAPIAFGTDAIFEAAGSSRSETTMRWIDSYVAAGIPPKDLLRAGMAADIIASPGNPLEDVQTLKHVAFVMKNGRVVRRP